MFRSNRFYLTFLLWLLIVFTLALTGCQPSAEEGAGEEITEEAVEEEAAGEETAVSDYEGDLIISVYGGTLEEWIREYVEPEFKNIYPNITLVYDVGGMSARYNKLLAQRETPEVDLFISTGEAAAAAIKEGLLLPVNKDNVPNIDTLYDWATPLPDYGAAFASTVLGLGYNPEFFEENPPEPTSWSDLWRPEVQGRSAVPAIGYSLMPQFIVQAAELNGGGKDNPQPGFEYLAELDPATQTFFYTDWNSLFDAGDVVLAVDFDFYIHQLADTGSDIEYVVPEEGGLGTVTHASVVAGTENQEAVERLINLMISPEIQQAVAHGDSLENVIWTDPEWAVEVRSEWTEKMNEVVAPAWSEQ